jgi:TolB-like protein/predicted Ser/Thr protein kinase
MPNEPPAALLPDLAAAILDGTPVDWNAADAAADHGERAIIAQLRVVAGVAGVHRGGRSQGTPALRPPTADTLRELHPTLEPPAQWGHLRIHDRIGQGSFGEVFRAWDTRLDREVALKLVSPSSTRHADGSDATIIEEGRLLARIRHPNVVTIYGAERVDGRIGLWMELVTGRTLQQIVEARQFLTVDTIADTAIQLAEAVHAVHAAGVLHRDIKAHNVMRDDRGRVVLMDFGTGRVMGESAPEVAGTPLYLAPEVLAGGEPMPRSDVYSIGVLMYYLLTASYPVTGRCRQDLYEAHRRGQRTGISSARPDLPGRLIRIIDRATSPEPADRYVDAGALASDLRRFREHARMVPWKRAAGVAAAIAVTLCVAWEGRGRLQNGSSPSRALVASAVHWLGPDAATVDAAPVVAVLPFDNLGPEAGTDYFVEGLTVEILDKLATIDGLRVRARHSSFAFKDRPRDLRAIARALNASLFLDGSVRRSGSSLRVNVELLQAGGTILWSRQFDSTLNDVLAIQEEIANAIVQKLRLEAGSSGRRYQIDTASYDLYLKARRLQADRATGPAAAIPLFEEVISRHPSFAPAHAALSGTIAELSALYPVMGGFAFPPEEALRAARPAALKALELDPTLAEAHAAIGHVRSLERDWTRAEASFRRSLELNPSLTTTYTDFVLSTLFPEGKLSESLRLLDAALQMDPLSLDVRRVMATVQISSGLYDAALDNCMRVVAMDPKFPFAEEWCARAELQKGDVAAAIARFEKHPQRNEGWLGYAYATSGRRAEAEAILKRNGALPHRQALIYAGLGDTDRAFESVERLSLLNARRAGSYLTYPELALLRGDPRVAALRERLGLPAAIH